MPACKDCKWIDTKKGTCKLAPSSEDRPYANISEHRAALRACRVGIVKKHQDNMGGRILEIGHGKQNLRRFVSDVGGVWYGVDPRWPDNPEIRHYGASVHDMPFDIGFFDWAIGLETMEHWGEYGPPLKMGHCLKEIHRVLKPGGKLLLTAPFFVHGTDDFFYGRDDRVKRYFFHQEWSDICFDEWRKDHEPLQPVYGWYPKWQRSTYKEESKRRAKKLVEKFGHEPSSWKLEIYATKA